MKLFVKHVRAGQRRTLRLGVGSLAAIGLVVLGTPGAGAATTLPYKDDDAAGKLTFCDASGKSITHGSTQDAPFASRIVGSMAAPAPFNGPGRTSIVAAYQPRPNVAPGAWSGEYLTAQSQYTDANHPMAAGVRGDESIGTFVSDFPPKVDGLIQIRLMLGLPNHSAETTKYSASSVKIDGNTWTLVDGGDAPCDSGSAVSIAAIYDPSLTQAPTATAPETPGSASSAGTAPTRPDTGGKSGGGSTASQKPVADSTHRASSTSSGSSAVLGWSLGGAVAALAAVFAGFVWWRRRSAA
ncbi:MAG: hypothetical protein JO147_03875 [Actinobacteria bacterium]|nr:hypothetical protein [Actinomycetota bacterium]